MDFLDKLDKDQTINANKVADEAIKMGVDPRLAVALAYQESGLRQDRIGESGEVGIMQIKPTTAKLVGFDRKQLDNIDDNIRAGLTYLKTGIDKFKDPLLATAGYNAGMDHPYFTDPKQGLPESTMSYVDSIKKLGGFSAPSPADQEASTTQTTTQKGGSGTVNVSEEDLGRMLAENIVEGGGALTGAGLAKAMDVIGSGRQRSIQTAEALRQIASQQPPLGDTPGSKWGAKSVRYVKPGVYSVKEMAEAYQRATPHGKVTGPLAKKWGIPDPGESSSIIDRMIARGQAAQQSTGAIPRVVGAAVRSPVLTGALGGFGAASSGMEAFDRLRARDPIGAAIAGVGAMGSSAAMLPHPIPKIVGGALATASPAALYLLDKMRAATPEGAQEMLGNVDIMGSPMP